MTQCIFFIAIITFLIPAESVHAQLTLDDVIANVRSAESLYANIEVIYRESYRLGNPKRTLPSFAKSASGTLRHVLQDGLIYFQSDYELATIEDKRQREDCVHGYDGVVTRILEQASLANINYSRVEDIRIVRPHLLLIKFGPTPKFQYLSEFMEADRHAEMPIQWRLDGEEAVDGLDCIRVRCDGFWRNDDVNAEPGKLAWYYLFWLAPERNYLVIKSMVYRSWSNGLHTDHPVDKGTVEKLMEIEPGIWFPAKVKSIVFDIESIVDDHKVVITGTYEREVEKVALDPKYELSLFRDIKFPPGIPIYEVRDGKIVSSSLTPENTDTNKRDWWPIVVGVHFLLMVSAAVAYFVYRRKVNTSTK